MGPNAGSVEAWMVLFLIQAIPTGSVLIRLSLIPSRAPLPRKERIFAFDGFILLFFGLLLLLDVIVSRSSPGLVGILLAVPVAAVYTLILSAEFSSHAAVSSFVARIFYPAPRFVWAAASLSMFPALFAIGYRLNSLIPIFPKATLFFHSFPDRRTLGHIPLIFITNAVFAGGIGGEPFWRGVLYPLLRKRLPFLHAALAAGLAQAVWLIPGWLVLGRGLQGILFLSALFISASPVFAWAYERSRRSLLPVIVMFGSMTTALNYVPLSFTTVGTVILLFPALLVAEKRIRRKR